MQLVLDICSFDCCILIQLDRSHVSSHVANGACVFEVLRLVPMQEDGSSAWQVATTSQASSSYRCSVRTSGCAANHRTGTLLPTVWQSTLRKIMRLSGLAFFSTSPTMGKLNSALKLLEYNTTTKKCQLRRKPLHPYCPRGQWPTPWEWGPEASTPGWIRCPTGLHPCEYIWHWPS